MMAAVWRFSNHACSSMKRSLIWLTLATACGLAMLISLGMWQLQRLAWKEDLISRIEARAHAAPVTLNEALRGQKEKRDIEFLRVNLAGEFFHGGESHIFTVEKGVVGWRIITPLRSQGGRLVLIDRGFVLDRLKDPASRQEGLVQGKIEITGLVRGPGVQSPFTPDNEPARNIWYWRDFDAMAKAAFSAIKHEGQVENIPFFVEIEKSAVPGGWPRGGATRLTFSNRHFEYALTWFGLAVALLGVYISFAWSMKKKEEFT